MAKGKKPEPKAAKPKADKPKGGRPSKYTPALVEAIAARLATGEPMAAICRDEGMPHPSTVRDWMAAREDVSLAIARAREDGFDTIAVEALRIADECRIGEKVKTNAAGEVIEKQTGDMVERARLQIDTRLKLLAKWDPKRYGDKVQLADSEGNNLPAPQFIIQPVKARDA